MEKESMKTFLRGLRGIWRNPLRAVLLTGLLTVSMGLSLAMQIVNSALSSHIDQIKAEVGTDVFLRPSVQGETMPEEDAASLADIPHVAKLAKKLTDYYTGNILVSAVPTEETIAVMKNRGLDEKTAKETAASMDIVVIGSDMPDVLNVRGRVTSGFGVTVQPSKNAEIIEGRTFTLDESDANVAILNQDLALSNELTVGSTIDINGTTVEIIGLFKGEKGDLFASNAIFLPFETTQRIFDKADIVTEAIVFVDDVANVDAVVASMTDMLGDSINITTNTDAYDELAAPVENAQNGSQLGMIVALVASVAVILFAMVQTVRSRIKEIGILKAVGASTWNVIVQFGFEAFVVGFVAAAIGALATFLFAQQIAMGLLVNIEVDSAEAIAVGPVEVVVSPLIFLYAFALAVGLALIGSAIPSWSIARVKPAEVLRYE